MASATPAMPRQDCEAPGEIPPFLSEAALAGIHALFKSSCLFSFCKLSNVANQILDVRIAQLSTVSRHFVLALGGDPTRSASLAFCISGAAKIVDSHLFAGRCIAFAVGSVAHGTLCLVVGCGIG